MVDEIIKELTTELEITDKNFNATLLELKVKSAYDDVVRSRKYPNRYTDKMIYEDMLKFKSNVKSIALYDYNKIGADFEDSHSENGTSRNYSDRNKLFGGIIPLSAV